MINNTFQRYLDDVALLNEASTGSTKPSLYHETFDLHAKTLTIETLTHIIR